MKKRLFKPTFSSSVVPGPAKPSPATPRKPARHYFRLAGKIFLYLFLAGLVATGVAFAYFAKDLPSPGKVSKRFIAESTKIFDRTGEHLLYEIHGEEKRTVIPFKDMPEVVRAATIALEDQDFYSHHGIKFSSILRAAFKDTLHLGAAQGASTITQQFVKNSLLTNEKTITRKIKEAILSLEMETKFSKDEILAMYLNEIPFGSNAYGIEAAAQTFFGKSARELGLDEAAVLAALPKGTAYYSPYGSHTDRLIARKDYALKQMAALGYITAEQADEAIAVETQKKVLPQKDIIAAPHFVMYVKDYLQQKYGDQAVEQGGYKVITTLDWEKQQLAETAVREGAEKNKKWKAANAALVAMDPKTGQILAMVGSKDYFDASIDGQVNVTIRNRQPGSSFKPYVYLTAFTKGYIPETVVYDVETNFETNDGKTYAPKNYDGKFHGPVSFTQALGGSLNIPAVKTLYLVGVKDAITMAKNLGVTTLTEPNRYGLSLVLGGGEVTLLDHVSAYGTLATGGVKHPKTAILSIADNQGKVLEEYQSASGERVVEERFVAMLDGILSNNANRAWIFGENTPLRFDNRPVVVKTGTTNEYRDAWTVGYTPSLSAGVWVGNNNNDAMAAGADGSVVAAPIWRAFLDKALANYAVEDFPKYHPEEELGSGENKETSTEETPGGIDIALASETTIFPKITKPMLNGKLDEVADVKFCQVPGKDDKYCVANKYCPEKETDKKDFLSGHDILFYVSRDDPRGDIPDKPDRDSQYKEWEKGVKKWYENKENAKHKIISDPPKEECKQSDFEKYQPKVTLSVSGEHSSTLTLSAKSDAPYGIDRVTFIVEGNEIDASDSDNAKANYSVPADKNNSTLSVEARLRDDSGNEVKDSKSVSVSF